MLKTTRFLNLFARNNLQQESTTILRSSLRRTLLQTTPARRTIITSLRPTHAPQQTLRPRRWHAPRSHRQNSTKPSQPELEEDSKSLTQLTMSARMKAMSKKYGWVVVGLYFTLSALDFPFCFLAVRLLGTERIAAAEHAVTSKFWEVAESIVPSLKKDAAELETAEPGTAAEVELAKGRKVEDASIWTQLLLAYGVHKSLIFIRIPITLAITPRVVKALRAWGWSIGKAK